LIRKPVGKPLGIMWKDDIKMYLRETGFDGGSSIELARNRAQWRDL
jgi:hypothetical protein